MSVSSVPDTVATSVMTASATRTSRLPRTAPSTSRTGAGLEPDPEAGASRQATVRSAATAPRATNGTRTPYAEPNVPPTTGPTSVPTVANDIAAPSTRPRSFAADVSESHARPAVHETADDSPCPILAARSTQNVTAPAYASVAAASRPTPKTVSLRSPTLAPHWPTIGDPIRT